MTTLPAAGLQANDDPAAAADPARVRRDPLAIDEDAGESQVLQTPDQFCRGQTRESLLKLRHLTALHRPVTPADPAGMNIAAKMAVVVHRLLGPHFGEGDDR